MAFSLVVFCSLFISEYRVSEHFTSDQRSKQGLREGIRYCLTLITITPITSFSHVFLDT